VTGRPSQLRTGKQHGIDASHSPQCPAVRTYAWFLGTALHHARAAVAALGLHGITQQARCETPAAREALNSALWLGEYVEADDASRD